MAFSASIGRAYLDFCRELDPAALAVTRSRIFGSRGISMSRLWTYSYVPVPLSQDAVTGSSQPSQAVMSAAENQDVPRQWYSHSKELRLINEFNF